MSRRLVACFRWHSVDTPSERYLSAAERIWRRCAQIGGRSISWSSEAYAFEFEPEAFRTVLRTVLELLSEANTHAVGLSVRELEADAAARFWGPALVVSEALARRAAAGEILLDPEIDEVQSDRLATMGSMPLQVGDLRIKGALLLPGSCPLDGFRTPSDAPGSPELEPSEARPRSDELPTQRLTEPPSEPIPPPPPPRANLASKAPPKPPSLRPMADVSHVPPTMASVQTDEAADPQSSNRRLSQPPPKPNSAIPLVRVALAETERPSVLDALKSRDPTLMSNLAAELNQSGGQQVLATRLEAMALLARGQSEQGLSLLEEAARAAETQGAGTQGMAERCQATLAYAVGLAQTGRKEAALHEALRGLSSARRGEDRKGERACAQLIAHLAQSVGYHDVAVQWQALVEH